MTAAARSALRLSADPRPARRPLPPRPWHAGVLVGFDLETTGTDTSAARVVTAALVHVDRTGTVLPQSRQWMLDPGVDIPAEAQAVHGISTAAAQRGGRPALTGVWEILDAVDEVWARGLPLVVFNAPYDLTLMDAEADRYGLPGLHSRASYCNAVVIDPLVIDRFADREREGPRTLEASATSYGVTATDPHSATGDALTACLLAREIARTHPLIGNADGATLHSAQEGWYRDRAVHVQAMRRAKGESEALVDKGWPVRDGRPVWFAAG